MGKVFFQLPNPIFTRSTRGCLLEYREGVAERARDPRIELRALKQYSMCVCVCVCVAAAAAEGIAREEHHSRRRRRRHSPFGQSFIGARLSVRASARVGERAGASVRAADSKRQLFLAKWRCVRASLARTHIQPQWSLQLRLAKSRQWGIV